MIDFNDEGTIFKSYSKRDIGNADFQVEYELSKSLELDQVIVKQGIRCDFRYESEKINYMIYPEFLDGNGMIILDKKIEVPKNGFANMWIFGDKYLHKTKLSIGVKGEWVVGSFLLAKVKVNKIFDIL